MAHYCDIAPHHPLHAAYHDTEYGFPSQDERVVFERLVLEIMQAGLSWDIVLKKRAAFRQAFAVYDIDKVAHFKADDITLLLENPSIIRNRRKIEAIIENAAIVIEMRKTGGFVAWLSTQAKSNRQDLALWTKAFRTKFRFMGPEIVKEFLMSLNYLEGAHKPECPVFCTIHKGHNK